MIYGSKYKKLFNYYDPVYKFTPESHDEVLPHVPLTLLVATRQTNGPLISKK
jgi:hypothetical protein